MTETQKRIEAYQKALPGIKEKVTAVAMLLALSVIMLTSASFAWLTISRAPEVTAVSTTIAGNGNLEIALATGDGTVEPGESAVGDSFAAEGQDVTAANITWGNLINLNDPSYGLDHLVLRPAQLNTNPEDILTNPLYGAAYSGDGRIEKLTKNFAYTSWIEGSGNIEGYFGISNDRGVRAISSTKKEVLGFAGDCQDKLDIAEMSNATARDAYVAITKNGDWMASLANLIGVHMTASLNGEPEYTDASIDAADLDNMIAMYEAFIKAYELEAQAMADILNAQLFIAYGGNTGSYSPYTKESILAMTPNKGNDFEYVIDDEKTAKLIDIKSFLSDYKMMVKDTASLKEIRDQGILAWSTKTNNNASDGVSLKIIVNHLVTIDTCIVDGKVVSELMKEFSGGMSGISTAMGYMNKEVPCVITNGVLYNFEQRVGSKIAVSANNSNGKKGLPVTAKMYVSSFNYEAEATIYVTITTSAETPYNFNQELKHAKGLNTGASSEGGTETAEDTYGLALDFWVRTNVDNSYLTLEGNVLTETEEIPAVGKDANGNDVDIYVLSRNETGGEGMSITYELYKVETKDAQGNVTATTWYDAETYSEFELNSGETPTRKMDKKVTVIGFEGENRVWDKENHPTISVDATTQGTGSCYIYYADTPEDQARSLELLKSMNVAFVDKDGNILARAKMDTQRYYAESGRVIVPLVLDASQSIKLGEDEEGNAITAITALEKNVPTLITAIVYLDGTMLGNDNVLAAADIQGQLNIQFGNNNALVPIEDEKLQNSERSASAVVSVSSFNFDTHEGDMTTRVTVTVNGDNPKNMSAFFMRKINETQGSREEEMKFTKQDGNTWIADYTFDAPGNYVLRTIFMDGQEYKLKTPPTVTISGFTVESFDCLQADNRHINVMTAENSSKVDLVLKFASDDASKMPKEVHARFLRDDGNAVDINFTYNTNTQKWEGSGSFLSSGDYTLSYLVLDKNYTELDENLWITANINLGMKVAVYTTSPTRFIYDVDDPTTAENKKNLRMQMKILDNEDEEIPGLTNVKLTYQSQSNALNTMDADLVWNAATGYYEGNMANTAIDGGTFTFGSVIIDNDDKINNATTWPVFNIISMALPSFVGNQTLPYQFTPDSEDAKMVIKMINTGAAEIEALIENENGVKGYSVGVGKDSQQTNENGRAIFNWTFSVPAIDDNGNQDGTWTIKELHMWDVYDSYGLFHTKTPEDFPEITSKTELPLVMDISEEVITTKVVDQFVASFAPNQNKTLGQNTAEFLEEQSFSGLTVTITDINGNALADNEGNNLVRNVKLTYTYDRNPANYGGYSITEGLDVTPTIDVDFVLDTTDPSGTRFVQSSEEKVMYAGTYTPSFTYTVGMNTITKTMNYGGDSGNALLVNTPTLTVYSIKPSVKITSIEPIGNHTIVNQDEEKDQNVTSSFTEYSATVYAHSKIDGKNIDLTTYPAVTLTLYNMGFADSAKMIFNSSEIRVKGNGNADKVNYYEWTRGTTTCTRYFGNYTEGGCSSANSDGIGTVKSISFVLIYGNVECSFTLQEITINNPDVE